MTESPVPTEAANDVLDLSGFFSRRKWHIFLGLCIGAVLAGLHYGLTRPVYRAEMEILVGQRSGDLARGATADASTEGVQAEQDILSTHIRVMKSRRIVGAAIESHGLAELKSVQEAATEGISPVTFIQEHLSVEKGGDGLTSDAHVLIATYDDLSPTDCALVLKALYDEYSKYLRGQFEGTSTEAIKLFTDLVRENAESVTEAERKISEELASSKLLWDGERSRNIHKDRLAQIEQKLNELTNTASETESRLRVISGFLENQDDQLITDLDRLSLLSEKEVSRLKLLFEVTRGDGASEAFQAEQPIRQQAARAEYEEYLALVMKEKKLLEKFSEGHPQVASVREQIGMMRQFIDTNSAKLAGSLVRERLEPKEMLIAYVGLLEHDLDDLKMQREVLETQGEMELLAAKELEKSEMIIDTLRREILQKKEIYDNSQKTLQELNFVRDYAGFSTDLIGAAEIQDKPNWPRLPISAAVGLMLGGLLGLGFAVSAELADQTFRDVRDLESTVGSDVIAHIPQMNRRDLRKNSKGDSRLAGVLCTFHAPRERASEVYRAARTSLLLLSRKQTVKRISMTSPAPGDGKSTTISNLAISLAASGKKVLLIDGDLRRPTLHRLFGVDAGLGVVDVVSGDCTVAEAILETDQPNLHLLTHGSITESPSELLESFAFESMLRDVEDKYDFILIDTPPVLSVTDPIVVGKLCDLVLLTVRINSKSRGPISMTCRLLEQAGLQPAAALVNGVDVSRHDYIYSRYSKSSVSPYSDQYYTDYAPANHAKAAPLKSHRTIATSQDQSDVKVGI